MASSSGALEKGAEVIVVGYSLISQSYLVFNPTTSRLSLERLKIKPSSLISVIVITLMKDEKQ